MKINRMLITVLGTILLTVCGVASAHVKVAVVRSWGSVPVFAELNDNWQAYGTVPLTVDTSLVNAFSFTYQDLANTGADVLWLSNPAGGAKRYSPAEIDAIGQYVSEGHSILGTFSVLQYADIDNRGLAPVFGLREDIVYNTTDLPANQVFDLLGGHPLFRNVPNPYVSGGWPQAQAPANDLTWDADDLGNAQLLAQTDDKRGVITWYETESYYAIYVSEMVEYIGNTTDTQFLYNALTVREPAIIYVDADAAASGDGRSWANAFNELQDALAAASSGDQIWVAAGIYKPDKGGGNTSGDRLATFQLISGVAIKGGYAGYGQPDPNARDIEAYETILSGDLYGNDIQVVNPEDLPEQPSRAENSYRLVTGSGCNQTAVLDGFTITAGNANGEYPLWKYNRGAGMYNEYGNPTVRNCTFSANSAEDNGAGMSNWESNPTIIDCSFSSNYARSNGGGMNNTYSSPTLANCTFSGNSANNFGGGMDNMFGSDPKLTNCTFTRNSATGSMSYGGGMYNHWSNPTLNNCSFSSNSASRWGGGMFNWDNTPTLTNCIFSGNSAGRWGGGICNWGDGNPTLASCMFTGNEAYEGGAIYNNGTTQPVLINCTFAVNSATHGKALACDSPEQEHPSNMQLLNCILWDGDDGIFNNDNSTITITYSDVQGGWPGEGNIDAYPRFGAPGSWELIKSMVSYWKFDEASGTTTYDFVGDNHGTVHGAQWTTGQVGGALGFDGDGDYVDCGNDSSLNPINNFSVSAWFNLNGAVTAAIVCKGNVPAYLSGGAYTIRCIPSNGILVFYVRDSSNTNVGYTITEVSLNEWTHVVGTFSDGNISIYKNGDFVANGVLGTSTINTNDGPLCIGAEGDGGTPFKGTIDEVAIHNKALSSEEIQQLYQIGLAGHSAYHLLPDSPCINAGDPNYIAEPNETDLDGNPRVIGDRIDMGVYEFNHIPVADAGPDREAYAWIDGIAQVTLDGTNSYDEDGQPLTYLWSWTVDSNTLTATEPNVTIELPVGEHIIELIVNDRIDDSEPNQVVITVIEPIQSQLWIVPRVINQRSHQRGILALLRLPEDVTKDQVDSEQPLLLYPGGIEAIRQYVIQSRRRRAQQVSILAFFDKGELMNAIPDEGIVELQVVGQLKTGRYFYGSDTVTITGRRRMPRRSFQGRNSISVTLGR